MEGRKEGGREGVSTQIRDCMYTCVDTLGTEGTVQISEVS